ncbi:MAG: sigma-70 family RNA polymerase sigma factor [Planctomycetota bacterium]
MSEKSTQPEPAEERSFTEYWLEAQHALGGFVRLHIRDHNLADDIIQEVAKQATANFERYDPSRPFVAWLIGIARQRMAEAFRQQGQRPVVFSTDVIESLTVAYAGLQDEVSDRMDGLRQCMEKLNDRHRRVLDLKYARRLTSGEIAKQVGGSAGSVDVMIHRLRTALRKCINQHLESRR